MQIGEALDRDSSLRLSISVQSKSITETIEGLRNFKMQFFYYRITKHGSNSG
jgi:hypothetical protein